MNFPVVSKAPLILLFLSGGSLAIAAAEWKKVIHTTQASIYIQTTTLSQKERLASVTTLANYAIPDSALNGRTYLSTLSRTNYDCIKRRSRVLVLTFYSEKWAGGQEAYKTEKPDEWRSVEHGSPNEKVLNIICRR